MTICISAICEEGAAIINASDDEVGVGFTSSALGRTKWDDLCKGWLAGFAGNVSGAMEVTEWTYKLSPSMPSTDNLDVRSMLETSYRKARMARVEAEILQSRGWTLQEFKDVGRQRLPDATYANIDAHMSLYDLGAELICSGWGAKDDFPSILTVTNPGVCVDHSRLGFWCIGSGATAAQMSLFSRNYSPDIGLEDALYYVAEAKFHAEKAAGVGQRTDIFIEWKGARSDALDPNSDVDTVRKIFNRLKQRDLDPDMRKTIGSIERVHLFKRRKQK